MLVIEDDPNEQKRIHKILKTFGYQENDIYFAQTISSAKEIYQENVIKFLLVDLNLPDGNGIEFIDSVRQMGETEAPIMVLSSWNALETIYNALSVGANGYVLKEKDDIELMFAIRSMLKGEAIIDPTVAKEILKKMRNKGIIPSVDHCDNHIHVKLSQRELEVLTYIANGFSSRETGAEMNISRYTVDVHIKKIYQKLEVNSRTKAIYTAKQIGLLS